MRRDGIVQVENDMFQIEMSFVEMNKKEQAAWSVK